MRPPAADGVGRQAGKSEFKRWLSSPPRPHGAIIKDRTVSKLELFYDLVYVAVIGAASAHLATDISIRGFVEFAIVFAMIWIAWLNGSIYVELHGREDGRRRMLLFLQMGILAVLAVFTKPSRELDRVWFFAVAWLIRAGGWGEPFVSVR